MSEVWREEKVWIKFWMMFARNEVWKGQITCRYQACWALLTLDDVFPHMSACTEAPTAFYPEAGAGRADSSQRFVSVAVKQQFIPAGHRWSEPTPARHDLELTRTLTGVTGRWNVAPPLYSRHAAPGSEFHRWFLFSSRIFTTSFSLIVTSRITHGDKSCGTESICNGVSRYSSFTSLVLARHDKQKRTTYPMRTRFQTNQCSVDQIFASSQSVRDGYHKYCFTLKNG